MKINKITYLDATPKKINLNNKNCVFLKFYKLFFEYLIEPNLYGSVQFRKKMSGNKIGIAGEKNIVSVRVYLSHYYI